MSACALQRKNIILEKKNEGLQYIYMVLGGLLLGVVTSLSPSLWPGKSSVIRSRTAQREAESERERERQRGIKLREAGFAALINATYFSTRRLKVPGSIQPPRRVIRASFCLFFVAHVATHTHTHASLILYIYIRRNGG